MGILDWIRNPSRRKRVPVLPTQNPEQMKVSGTTPEGWYYTAREVGEGESRLSLEESVWKGDEIQHAYRSSQGCSKQRCPKCKGPIEQKYVGLIYVSPGELRRNISPCAFICENCSAAVIDESFPRQTAKEQGYEYCFPLAIYSPTKPAPRPSKLKPFETYEGHTPVFIVDEHENMQDVIYQEDYERYDDASDGMFSAPSLTSKSRERARKKRKLQKVARRKSRAR